MDGGSSIDFNIAVASGGGVFLSFSSQLRLDGGSSLSRNKAYSGGGAYVYKSSRMTLVDGSRLVANVAKQGGGVALSGATVPGTLRGATSLSLHSGSGASNNTATFGGFAFLTGKWPMIFGDPLSRSIIEGSASFDDGGAVYVESAAHDIRISNLDVRSSTAKGRGTAIFVGVGCKNASISNTLSLNHITLYYGAFVYVSLESEVHLADVESTNDRATNNGGIIYVAEAATLIVSRLSVLRAAVNMGVIFVRSSVGPLYLRSTYEHT